MSITRILTLFLIGSAWWFTGCAGKVSGRFDMEQKFRTGVRVKLLNPD